MRLKSNKKKARNKKVDNNKKKSPLNRRYIIYLSLVAVGVFFAAAALRVIIGGLLEDASARAEYDQLRDDFPAIANQELTPEPIEEDIEEPIEEEDDIEEIRALSLDELAAINSDFIGWINIGHAIDYPVVRGRDNVKYINTTFTGHRNSAGAIFMDYRNTNGFDEHVSVIYGHYTRDGSMFSSLGRYLDSNFLRQNPNITITTRDGRTLTYRIFAAKLTDAWDDAYTIALTDSSRAAGEFPNAPSNASRFMLLSTCTRSSNDDERILVFAAMT